MKWLKRILGGLAALIVLLIGVTLFRFFVLLPEQRAAQDVKAPQTPQAIERGKYLVNNVAGCLGCHSTVDEGQPGEPIVQNGKIGGGRVFPDSPTFPGKVRSPNITSDKEHGIGAWTDGEVLRALREGIGRDGRVLFPMMPYPNYAKALSDEDALAIIAYLRTLAPVAEKAEPTQIVFPVSMFIRAAPKPVTTPAGPLPTTPLERGQALLTLGSCGDCHTPMDKGQPIPGKAFAGGMSFTTPKGEVRAANITSDKATGIGSYSDEDLMRVLNEGVSKSGRPLYIMPWTEYRHMTDEDKRAIVTALKAIPPVANIVAPPSFK